jgi:uncharacterized protein YdeI (YjbR/CyaY-like superfamily)
MSANKDPRANRSKPSRAAAQYPRIAVESRAALRSWLLANHASSRGAWVVTRKRAAGGVVAWDDVVEESLCFGWVDSLPRKLDDDRSMLLITPRKATSKWSVKNQQHVLDLERRQLMHPAGRAVVAAARSSGTWNALDAVSALIVPDDLATALASHAPANQHWEAFPPSTRRGILEWIEAAKRAQTRAARIAETARLAKDNVRANQWPRRRPGHPT